MPSSKYKTLDELQPLIRRARASGKVVALANGGFDLLHIGHVRYLQAAKALADILVVALNSDASLKRLKGDGRALIDAAGRVEMIAALTCVDYVTLFDEDRVDCVLLALTPDFHCKGSDYTADTVPEKDVVKSYGGRVAIVGGEKVRSTSLIVESIRELYG